ncbi:MAG: hypothetical protein WBL25_02300 [Anaerolineales bacterium]
METIRDLMVAEYREQVLERGGNRADELEYSIREDLVALGNDVLGEVLSSYDEEVNGSSEKCACGGRAKRQLRRVARMLSVFGWDQYERGYYHCSYCDKREYRLDASQGIRAGQANRGMARLMSMAGVTTSFAEASQQIRDYLLVEVSPNTIRKESYATGKRQARREAQEQERSEQLESLQQRERRVAAENRLERGYGSIDGAQAPTLTGWQEVKSLALYQSQYRYGHPDQLQATEIEYHSEITPAEEFGRLLWASALNYQADRAQELVFVCDGAAWIWKLVEKYFPDAVQIVDWYHACGYLTEIASADLDISWGYGDFSSCGGCLCAPSRRSCSRHHGHSLRADHRRLLIDTIGIAGYDKVPLTLPRLAGLAFMVIGVYLVLPRQG